MEKIKMFADGIGCNATRRGGGWDYSAYIDFYPEDATYACDERIVEFSVHMRIANNRTNEEEKRIHRRLLNELFQLLMLKPENFEWKDRWNESVKSCGNEHADEFEEFGGCWERLYYSSETGT